MDILAKGVQWLERGARQRLPCPIGDLRLLADSYGIQSLMLDPLLTEEARSTSCHVQSRDRLVNISAYEDERPVTFIRSHLAALLRLFREQTGETKDEIQQRLTRRIVESPALRQHREYGAGAVYQTPKERLQGTEDVSVVLLTLKQNGGRCGLHAHPGDEAMFVRKGMIEVRFLDSGMCSTLTQGDFIHFYAEQIHCTRNVGDCDAEVLVMRFLQLGDLGPRYRFYNEIQKQDWKDDLRSRIRFEIGKSLVPFDESRAVEAPNQQVVDRFGLGRLLRHIVAESNDLSHAKLVVRAIDSKMRFNSHARLHRLHYGLVPVKATELVGIASLHGVVPLLLYNYLHSVHRPAIAVRGPGSLEWLDDWDEVPADYVNVENIRYFVPRRRLADSDVSISLLTMAANAGTPPNRHPGYELILPICGSVIVRSGDLQREVEVAEGAHLYCHFDSSQVHEVINKQESEARVIVIRFYGSTRNARPR